MEAANNVGHHARRCQPESPQRSGLGQERDRWPDDGNRVTIRVDPVKSVLDGVLRGGGKAEDHVIRIRAASWNGNAHRYVCLLHTIADWSTRCQRHGDAGSFHEHLVPVPCVCRSSASREVGRRTTPGDLVHALSDGHDTRRRATVRGIRRGRRSPRARRDGNRNSYCTQSLH